MKFILNIFLSFLLGPAVKFLPPFCFGEPAGDQYLAVWRPFYGQVTIVAATWLYTECQHWDGLWDIFLTLNDR